MLQFTKCFHSFECFHGLEMGDICIIQLTCSRLNRSGFYCAIKSNAEHASFIYAICQWELLCFLQQTYRLVFCFTDEEGSYSTNSWTLGSQQNLRFRIFAFNCFRKIAKNDGYLRYNCPSVFLSVIMDQFDAQWMAFSGFRYMSCFRKIVQQFQVLLKSYKNYECFRWTASRVILFKIKKMFRTKAIEN